MKKMNEDTKVMQRSLEKRVKDLKELIETKTIQRQLVRDMIRMEKKSPDKDRESIKRLEQDYSDRRFELFRLDDEFKKAKQEYDKFIFVENCRQRQNAPGAKRVQLTMNAFVSVKTPDGEAGLRWGPKVLQDDSDLNCYPCYRTFKSIEGRREHQRYCHRYRFAAHELPKDEEHWLNKRLIATASEAISPSKNPAEFEGASSSNDFSTEAASTTAKDVNANNEIAVSGNIESTSSSSQSAN